MCSGSVGRAFAVGRAGIKGLLVRDAPQAVAVFLSLSKSLYPLLSIGSTQVDSKSSQHDEKMLTGT